MGHSSWFSTQTEYQRARWNVLVDLRPSGCTPEAEVMPTSSCMGETGFQEKIRALLPSRRAIEWPQRANAHSRSRCVSEDELSGVRRFGVMVLNGNSLEKEYGPMELTNQLPGLEPITSSLQSPIFSSVREGGWAK